MLLPPLLVVAPWLSDDSLKSVEADFRKVLQAAGAEAPPVEDFVDFPGIGGLVLSLEDSEQEWLDRIATRTTHPAVKASLALREANSLMDHHRFDGLTKEQRTRLDDLLDQLMAEDWAGLADPLGRGTIGDQAKQARFELEHLSIGSLAPDIVGKDLEQIRKTVQEENITWRSFWNGPEGPPGPIAKAWNVTGWPTLFLLDAEGRIRRRWIGGEVR